MAFPSALASAFASVDFDHSQVGEEDGQHIAYRGFSEIVLFLLLCFVDFAAANSPDILYYLADEDEPTDIV